MPGELRYERRYGQGACGRKQPISIILDQDQAAAAQTFAISLRLIAPIVTAVGLSLVGVR